MTNQTDKCDHHIAHTIAETEVDLDDEEATDHYHCEECGAEWSLSRGATYGEIVDGLTDRIEEEQADMAARADEFREEGGPSNQVCALVLERASRELSEAREDLEHTRRALPFGTGHGEKFAAAIGSPAVAAAAKLQRERVDSDTNEEDS